MNKFTKEEISLLCELIEDEKGTVDFLRGFRKMSKHEKSQIEELDILKEKVISLPPQKVDY